MKVCSYLLASGTATLWVRLSENQLWAGWSVLRVSTYLGLHKEEQERGYKQGVLCYLSINLLLFSDPFPSQPHWIVLLYTSSFGNLGILQCISLLLILRWWKRDLGKLCDLCRVRQTARTKIKTLPQIPLVLHFSFKPFRILLGPIAQDDVIGQHLNLPLRDPKSYWEITVSKF